SSYHPEGGRRPFRGSARIPDAVMIYQAATDESFPVAAPPTDAASADDLFQQTWLHVVRQLHRYDAARSFDTWLFAIAHNAAMDLLRRRPGESLEDREFAIPSRAPDAFSTVLVSQRAAIRAAALAELPALYREALTLRFEEGMRLEEIAEVTHAPLSTVKSRVCGAA